MAEAFSISRASLEYLIRFADHVPPTLNIATLHGRNIALDDQGICKFHDWDNAMIGPPGMSLSGFAGSLSELVRWYVDGRPETDSAKVALLMAYVGALEEAGYAGGDDLVEAVIGAAVAGLLVRLVKLSPYRPNGEAERRICVDDLPPLSMTFSKRFRCWLARIRRRQPPSPVSGAATRIMKSCWIS